ncbi:armadillo repeat-containing protein 3-like [Pomacea canaliculata]|uniref:armadillo repeat-containing protein 3-like n=1 Tax=Pomacea canaliculata TaxID=400727 RepID=UPI000D73C1B9|nr:armadillo repeat-containing protein 3-like [Pomacea canaliculata]
MGKKVKKDEKPQPDDVFDALLVESRNAATVVLMLSSPEEDVQSKACEAIYKFVDKCEENKKILLDLKAVDPLLKLMQGEDETVRRYATMGLSVMCQNSEVRKFMRKRDDFIPTLINLLHPDIADNVLYEFATLGLSFMATEYSSKVKIFECGGVEPLVRLLSASDPDVQKNSIEALAQMALDFQARCSIRENDGLPSILELLKSDYAVIQKLALLALERLMQEVGNRNCMRELDGVSRLLEILARQDLFDLHVMVVMVLANLLEDLETLEQMKEKGGLKKLVMIITDQPAPEDDSKKLAKKESGSRAGKKSAKDAKSKKGADEEKDDAVSGMDSITPTLPDVKMCAAKAIARCAKNSQNRRILHEQEVEKMLIILLGHESVDVQMAAAHAIGIICETLSFRDSIKEWGGLPPLLKLLSIDHGDLKEAVTLTIANLTSSNLPNCQDIVNLGGLDLLIAALGDLREEVIANVACVLTNIAQDETLRMEAISKGVVTALVDPLRSSNTNVQSKAALAVSAFTCDADARAEFRESGGLEPLVMLLQSGNDEVRRNTAWAITVCGVDEPTASEICRLGGLDILQQIQLSSTRQSSFIDAALERLLDSNTSAKYALTGYLSTMNLVEDGFYDPGQLRPGTQFQTLEDYLKEPVNDKRPIFFINGKLQVTKESEKTEESDFKVEASKSSTGKISKVSGKDSKTKSKAQREKEEKQREEELAAQAQKEAEAIAGKDKNTLEPPSDPSFVRYLEEVHEKVLPLSTTVEQITVLARYVAEKMGGPIERGQLPHFSWELPMSQIRFEIKSNVIPIGKIKMGIHTHRALLFKALADRTSVACTLTRGNYNRVWNEVLVGETDQAPGAPKLPPSRYIVDLIHEPGKLLPIYSHEAVAYQKV